VAAPELLLALLRAAGPSGYEAAPSAVWRDAAAAFAEVTHDALGSSVARVSGQRGGPLLAVIGHIDEIGLVVTHIDDKGFLFVRNVGGWDAEVLVGQRVEIATRSGSVPGVVGRKARPRRKAGEERKPTELEELHVDIGATSADEARALVRLGDAAVIAAEPLDLPNGRLVSRALDNRLGAYVALEVARAAARAEVPGDVAGVAAVQEEAGDLGGARTIAFSLQPDVALAVDVTPATDTPGGDPKLEGAHDLGAGPVVQRGSTINPHVFELLCECADAEGIPYSLGVSAGTTYTDMDAVHLSRAGVPAGLVSIPTRYLHTPTEVVALADVDATIRLITAFARRLEPGTTFPR
jgi:endoglucanase